MSCEGDINNRILAMVVAQQAQIELLLAIVEELGKKCGVTTIGGLPLRDWFQKKKLEDVGETLLKLEDKDPGLAAALQEIIDESKRRLGEQ